MRIDEIKFSKRFEVKLSAKAIKTLREQDINIY